ncbi:hypothetical protein D9615_001736 [Tricholomella constricta]|uniref:J domain-containing protein n=1 Tax=Tricholomella constricta TaxID=117010 RepID=A0A8H5HNU3_9AGAR|nr:hypothetical protein D9615_001736 [Tricholomella constricta]
MVLRTQVIDAFKVLGVPPDTDEATASKAYKKLALLHHPDRNHGDSTSTARFQEIGAAWDICTRHYENPRWSEAPEPGTQLWPPHNYGPGMYYDDEDDYYEMDAEERYDFFRFMFYETFMGGYSRSKRQRFRSERHRGFEPSFLFSRGSSNSTSHCSDSAQEAHAANQRKEKKKYEQRMREFEMEIEAEEREIRRVEREKKLHVENRLSAQLEAFELARAGDSLGVRNLIERHSLDVNSPERASKHQKKPQSTSFQTLLHVATSRCNEELVAFLLEKGLFLVLFIGCADMTALNKENLTPFHQSILSGNTPVVRFFLTRRAKPSGCHPSKAAADGRTPLQLAITSHSVSTVELLLKDATVHDVERCWEQEALPVAIKDILETKKGFVPRSTSTDGPPMSRKALLKAEAVRRQVAQQEEKAKRIAEERARAAENLRRKEERAARRVEEERLKEEARRELEEKERQNAEAHRLAEQERRRAEAETGALRKAKEEALLREKEAARRRAEEEERQRVELEARCRAEAEARRKAEQEARRSVEQEERRKVLEMEARQRVGAEARQKELARQKEAEACQREAEDRRKFEEVRARVEQEAQVREDERRQAESNQRKPAVAAARNRPMQDAAAKRAETLRRLQAQAEDHKRRVSTLKCRPALITHQIFVSLNKKIQRQQAEAGTIIPQQSPVSLIIDTKEEIIRKRAEQSARDKARNQRVKEERAKLERAKCTEVGLESSSVIADTQKKRPTRVKKIGIKGQYPNAPQQHPSYPLTPSSMSSSPLSWSADPSFVFNATSGTRAAPLSPPMTPEDLQTCAIPDDLFMYERPTQIVHEQSSPAPPSPGSPGRAQGLIKGRGSRGRGRGRGGYTLRLDDFKLGAFEAEEELARKNHEIERLSAELAALRAGAP